MSENGKKEAAAHKRIAEGKIHRAQETNNQVLVRGRTNLVHLVVPFWMRDGLSQEDCPGRVAGCNLERGFVSADPYEKMMLIGNY